MSSSARGNRRPMPLLWSVVLLNSLVLLAAGLILALSPATVSHPVQVSEAATIVAGVAAVIVLNALLVRRSIDPVRRLTETMSRVDLMRPGERVSSGTGGVEVAQLAAGFNRMLERLERERRESTAGMLRAQERERGRLARELHDEIGQDLTALTLELAGLARNADPALAGDLAECRELARDASEAVGRVVDGLRPDALDQLGLAAALRALGQRASKDAGIDIRLRLDEVGELSDETELVIYRVAQESLTNVIRHSGSSTASLRLATEDGAVTLEVADRGRGVSGEQLDAGHGIRGMRERALLAGGSLTVDRGEVGTRVRLRVPTRGAAG